jgi:hypothetical protein
MRMGESYRNRRLLADESRYHVRTASALERKTMERVGTGYNGRFGSVLGEHITTRQLLITLVFAGLFVIVSVYVAGWLAAIGMPHRYAVFARTSTHRHLAIQLWELLKFGAPLTIFAALCGAALGRLTRNPNIVLALIALLVWMAAPVGIDLLAGNPWSEAIQDITVIFSLTSPASLVTNVLVWLAFLLAFRRVARRSK